METDIKTERILNLYDSLLSGKSINLHEEVNRTGVSERSIKRDIAEIRNHLENSSINGGCYKELVYDRKDNCYYLTENGRRTINHKEIYAMSKILMGSKGLSKKEMERAVYILLNYCEEDKKRKEIKNFIANEIHYYRGPSHGKILIDHIWEIAEAVEYKKKLKIRYTRLEGHRKVERILKPLGILFSEYYFYMLAFIDGIEKKDLSPTIYRVDRIENIEVLEENFQSSYSEKFSEQKFRERTPMMWGGTVQRLKFWYKGPALDVVLDKIPTAKVINKQEGNYLLSAEVVGVGAEMWLRSQGELVEIV